MTQINSMVWSLAKSQPLGCSSTSPLFFIREWNTKVGSQEIPEATGKFGLGVKNEVGQRLTEFCQENAPVITHTLSEETALNMDITR